MLTYDLDKRGDKPLYEYLYLCIREDIRSGKIRPGERLPSKRSLAEHLRVSTITVMNAYEQLLAEGYITSVEKKGYFASDVGLGGVALNNIERRKKSVTEKEQNGSTAYSFDISSNTPDPTLFPFSVWSRLMRRVLSEQDAKLLSRQPFNGSPVLRKAIADSLYRLRGMETDPECIIIGAGTEFLYNLIIQLMGKDKRFAVENPGYKKLAHICERSGVEFCAVDVDEYGMSSRALEISGADIVHISPSHHYPTGIVMPAWRRGEILAYARHRDGYIIEDDYDSEFRFSGKPVPSLKSFDEHGRVIYMNTFSQTISPSIRISYMILPSDLMRSFREQMSFYSCTVPSFEQYTLASFLDEGYFEKHINRMKHYYRQRRDKAMCIAESSNDGRFSIIERGAGTHFLLELDTEKSDREIGAECLAQGLKVSFVSDYLYSELNRYNSCAVVSYAGRESEDLEHAIEILKRCI